MGNSPLMMLFIHTAKRTTVRINRCFCRWQTIFGGITIWVLGCRMLPALAREWTLFDCRNPTVTLLQNKD